MSPEQHPPPRYHPEPLPAAGGHNPHANSQLIVRCWRIQPDSGQRPLRRRAVRLHSWRRIRVPICLRGRRHRRLRDTASRPPRRRLWIPHPPRNPTSWSTHEQASNYMRLRSDRTAHRERPGGDRSGHMVDRCARFEIRGNQAMGHRHQSLVALGCRSDMALAPRTRRLRLRLLCRSLPKRMFQRRRSRSPPSAPIPGSRPWASPDLHRGDSRLLPCRPDALVSSGDCRCELPQGTSVESLTDTTLEGVACLRC